MSEERSNSASPLPRGWECPSLAEIARVNPPLARRIEDDNVDVNFVPMRAVEPEGGGLLRPEVRSYGEVRKGYTAFVSGDVIMAKITPCMENGKTTVVPELPGSICFGSTEFHVIRAEDGVAARWIANYLLQHEVRRAAQRRMAGGVGQMRVPSSFLETVRIPLAPPREQVRIADAIDELLSDLDAGVAALERVREKLKLYRAAVLKVAVEGVLTGSSQPYPTRPMGEIVESIGQGWSPKCERFPSTALDTWGVIKTTAIQPMQYLQEHNKQLPASLNARPHLELKTGDLLITRAGPRSRVGVACLVRQTRPRLMLCDKAYRLRCRTEQALPEFLELALNAPQIVDDLERLKTGISDSGVNLTQQRFAELRVPLPSPDEQARVVEAVEDQLSVIQHLEADLQTRPRSAHGLRQAILRHAFTGKLVSQDPSDEPASALLGRIATQRETSVLKASDARLSRTMNRSRVGRRNRSTNKPVNGE
jgi:type I restriction enzyme, S subunit